MGFRRKAGSRRPTGQDARSVGDRDMVASSSGVAHAAPLPRRPRVSVRSRCAPTATHVAAPSLFPPTMQHAPQGHHETCDSHVVISSVSLFRARGGASPSSVGTAQSTGAESRAPPSSSCPPALSLAAASAGGADHAAHGGCSSLVLLSWRPREWRRCSFAPRR